MEILSETPVEGKPGYMGTSILSKYAVWYCLKTHREQFKIGLYFVVAYVDGGLTQYRCMCECILWHLCTYNILTLSPHFHFLCLYTSSNATSTSQLERKIFFFWCTQGSVFSLPLHPGTSTPSKKKWCHQWVVVCGTTTNILQKRAVVFLPPSINHTHI